MLTKKTQQLIKERQQQEEELRRKIVAERCGQPKQLTGLSDGMLIQNSEYNVSEILIYILDQLKAICKEYYDRIKKIESEKWELERHTTVKDQQVRIVYRFHFLKNNVPIFILISK